MSYLEFTEDKNFPPQSAGKQAVAQHSKPNYPAALAWAMGGLLVAGVLLYIAAPKQVSQPRQLSLTAASQTETPEIIAKNVEDIQAGDVVVSYDEATGEQVFNRVVETYERISDHLRFIETRSLESCEVQIFETTDEHPFWQVDIGWIEAGKLKPGDQLLQSNGQFAEVVSTRYEAHPEGVTVYNFQVAHSHSYYVSAPTTRSPPILVHNANYVPTRINLDPNDTRIIYRETKLKQRDIDDVRPFNQALSDRHQPIRIVIDNNGNHHIMNGNHRIAGAADDGIPSVEVEAYTPDQWKEAFGIEFDSAKGVNFPIIE